LQRRTDHWRGVAIAACAQCGRNRVPLVESGPSFEAACQGEDAAGELRLMLLPQARDSLAALTPGLRAATLLVGPEGGLSNREQLLAQRGGFRACRLGPRILRAETAPLAALAALQAMAGDLA
jgi:16S rRNA (uracil1498-N3)-methyltransferase